IIIAFYETGNRSHFGYCEPFFGAGAIGFKVLSQVELKRAWLNDRDPAICCVWERVLRDPQGLQASLCEFVPSVAAFYHFKAELQAIESMADVSDPESVALKKIVCHQMSYSGLGTQAGGAIGGRKQAGRYDVGCRYSLKSLLEDVDKAAELLDRVELHPDVCSN